MIKDRSKKILRNSALMPCLGWTGWNVTTGRGGVERGRGTNGWKIEEGGGGVGGEVERYSKEFYQSITAVFCPRTPGCSMGALLERTIPPPSPPILLLLFKYSRIILS